MSEQVTRARSALERKWIALGKFAHVCGEWTVCNFLVSGAEKHVLYRGKERCGVFETRAEAMNQARQMEAA